VSIDKQLEGVVQSRWLEVRAERLNRNEGGAVVSHLDITLRKRAELEASQNLETMSHLNRVAAMGELTASLAHELNQPISGIVTTGAAVSMLLEDSTPDLPDIREAIVEMREDGERAATIIRNMRAMVKGGRPALAAISVNDCVRGAERLIANEARLRHIRVQLNLSMEETLVLADAVQLQQVILNLMRNGMDAVDVRPAEQRRVEVYTHLEEGCGAMVLEVRDSGEGLKEEWLARLFEPFFTTKSYGLGMGLRICRSILQSVGGKISASNLPGGGAMFRVRIPAANNHATGD
jgi:C4-dicarboxylate-specific signal transduction histidine kinase